MLRKKKSFQDIVRVAKVIRLRVVRLSEKSKNIQATIYKFNYEA